MINTPTVSGEPGQAPNDLVGSMGRVASAGDNAAIEIFFALPQKNVLDIQRWDIREELRLAIVTWIETKYNHRRRQRAFDKQTPVEFDAVHLPARRGVGTINPQCQPILWESQAPSRTCRKHERPGPSRDRALCVRGLLGQVGRAGRVAASAEHHDHATGE